MFREGRLYGLFLNLSNFVFSIPPLFSKEFGIKEKMNVFYLTISFILSMVLLRNYKKNVDLKILFPVMVLTIIRNLIPLLNLAEEKDFVSPGEWSTRLTG